MSELKGQQKEFCDYLLLDPEQNATAAYLKAYPSSSPNAARANAARLLASDNIQAYLDNARAARSERTRIDADWLLRRLAEEADADVAELFDEAGNLLPVRKWPKIFRTGLVAGIDVANQGDGSSVAKIKLADRNAKLKMIGDHIGVAAFKQHVTNTLQGPGGGPVQVIDAAKLSNEALAEILNAKNADAR